MTEPPIAVRIRGLTKSFSRNPVLRGIDLDVPRGQVLGYVGPNGAGKSTTVRILAGMDAQFEGDVEVLGHSVRDEALAVKRKIGFLPENARLYEALTVEEHLLLVGRLQGLDDTLILERGHAFLEAFELKDRLVSRLGALSKGMRQKVMIASALLHDPELLFLDEPLSGLDVHSAVLLKELVQELARRGRTVFYCSHMMDVVERVCDRIAVLADGDIVAQGSFEELQRGGSETLERIFLELTSSGDERSRAQAIVDAFGPQNPSP